MILIEEVKKKYGSEIALVLLCCRRYFETTDSATVQQFIDNNKLDWSQVFHLCGYHRIEPLVYKILSNVNIPEKITLSVKQKQLLLVQQSFIRALETERIINLLGENGIKCTAYKGVAFSKQFYGDLVSRESSDIDLVVSPKDFGMIMGIMKKNGYSFESQFEYDYFKEQIFTRRKDLSFNKYNNGFREFHVEFHWRISERALQIKKETTSLLFENNVDINLAKCHIKTLNQNAHYLAVLIHHSNNDALSILRNLIDIGHVINNVGHSIQTDYIKKKVSDFNLKRAVALCVFLSKELLGINLPFSNDSSVNISKKIKIHFMEHLLQKKWIGDHFQVKLFSKSVFFLKDNRKEKVKYLAACLKLRFTPSVKDFRVFNLPKPLHFLYPILKPFRSILSPSDNKEEKKIVMKNSEQSSV